MASVIPSQVAAQLEQMHTRYRQGGADRAIAPKVVYRDAPCPKAKLPRFPNCRPTGPTKR